MCLLLHFMLEIFMPIILLGDFLSLVIHKRIVLASTLGTSTLLHTLPGHFSD